MTKKDLFYLIKSITNISTTLSHIKEILAKMTNTVTQNSIDTNLIKDNINDIKKSLEKICELINCVEKNINMLNVQLDYKERVNLKNNITVKKFFEAIILFFKNSKWISLFLLLLLVFLTILFNKTLSESVMNLIKVFIK